MDVDTLTFEKQTKVLRKGICFHCKKAGHISKDCSPKNNYQSYNCRKNSEAPVQKKRMDA
jgi:hypothetical protein